MDKEVKLTDGSVLIRPYRSTDVQALHEAVRESVAELSVWMRWCHPGYRIQESRTWIRSCAETWAMGTEFNFAIIDAEEDTLLGSCGLNAIVPDDHIANLGYWVRTARTRTGVATAAASLAVRFGFEDLQLNRIQIIAAITNEASLRVADKVGAVREGILRNRFAIHGKIHDAVMFSLIPPDLQPQAGPSKAFPRSP
jgi:RimJ/RimL family protein N-acetyltransferase